MSQSQKFNLPLRLITILLAAVGMAYVSAKLLFNGSIVNTPVWGLLALGTALLAKSRRQSLQFGAIFGFVVSYAFLWFDDTSKITPTQGLFLTLLIIAPALFGALCGTLAAALGWWIRSIAIRQN